MNRHQRRELNREKEKTLRAAWMISLAAPVTTLIAFLLGGATVQMADFLRRTSELAGLFLAWWTFRRTADVRAKDAADRLEHLCSLAIALVMGLSFLLITYAAASRLLHPQPLGMIAPGLVIPIGGIIVNGWFWRRGAGLARQESSPVVESQWRLCRAKAVLDVCVLLTLLLTLLVDEPSTSRYIDLAGSSIIGIFLLTSAWRMGRPAVSALVAISGARDEPPAEE